MNPIDESRDCGPAQPRLTNLPKPDEVLHQAIDMIRSSVEERTKAVQAAMAQLNDVVGLLESYEEALRKLGGKIKPTPKSPGPKPKPKRRRGSDALRSPLGLTPNGQKVYDALPKDGSKIGLRELSVSTGLGRQPVGVVASHLARHHPHLVEQTGVSVYRRAKGSKGEGVTDRLIPAESSVGFRCGIASDPSTPPKTLAALATDVAATVRFEVAVHPSTPLEALAALAADADASVRYGAARNPSTPPKTLAALAADAEVTVRFGAVRNPGIPPQALADLAASADAEMRCEVAHHRNTPSDVLAALAADADENVRLGVALHPNTPIEALAALAADASVSVRFIASTNSDTQHMPKRTPGLTPNGQRVYDALPKDGSRTSLKELRQITGLPREALALVASHLARQNPHLVYRMGFYVYRRTKGSEGGA